MARCQARSPFRSSSRHPPALIVNRVHLPPLIISTTWTIKA